MKMKIKNRGAQLPALTLAPNRNLNPAFEAGAP